MIAVVGTNARQCKLSNNIATKDVAPAAPAAPPTVSLPGGAPTETAKESYSAVGNKIIHSERNLPVCLV